MPELSDRAFFGFAFPQVTEVAKIYELFNLFLTSGNAAPMRFSDPDDLDPTHGPSKAHRSSEPR